MRRLWKGKLVHPATKFVGVPVTNGAIGAHIIWNDNVSNAAITLELSSKSSEEAPVEAAADNTKWKDSGVAVTGPTAVAADSSLVNVENCRQTRSRLKIVTAANTDIEIWGP